MLPGYIWVSGVYWNGTRTDLGTGIRHTGMEPGQTRVLGILEWNQDWPGCGYRYESGVVSAHCVLPPRWGVLDVAAGYATSQQYTDEEVMMAAGVLEGVMTQR